MARAKGKIDPDMFLATHVMRPPLGIACVRQILPTCLNLIAHCASLSFTQCFPPTSLPHDFLTHVIQSLRLSGAMPKTALRQKQPARMMNERPARMMNAPSEAGIRR